MTTFHCKRNPFLKRENEIEKEKGNSLCKKLIKILRGKTQFKENYLEIFKT